VRSNRVRESVQVDSKACEWLRAVRVIYPDSMPTDTADGRKLFQPVCSTCMMNDIDPGGVSGKSRPTVPCGVYRRVDCRRSAWFEHLALRWVRALACATINGHALWSWWHNHCSLAEVGSRTSLDVRYTAGIGRRPARPLDRTSRRTRLQPVPDPRQGPSVRGAGRGAGNPNAEATRRMDAERNERREIAEKRIVLHNVNEFSYSGNAYTRAAHSA
jgi:hypothetical protein